MNEKEKMYQKIRMHGEALKRLFIMPPDTDAVKLCKRVFRVENMAHRAAEDYCNGKIDGSALDSVERAIFRRLSKIFGMNVSGPVFFNTDPRGYALKLTEKETKESGFYFRDMGGNGILAPDFREQ